MNLLGQLVGSKIRAEIFRLLFAGTDLELHVREIQRRTGFNDRAIRQELAKLARLDLLLPRRDGNRLYYSARKDHPLYREIRQLAVKTLGVVDVLRSAMDGSTVVVAFVFGSIARGEEKALSDVDLLAIGPLGLREMARLLAGVSDRLGREINPHVMTVQVFHKRLEAKDPFLSRVMRGPKLFVKGHEQDLAELAR